MKITAIEPITVAIPYRHDGPLTGFGGTLWPTLNYLLVKVSTDDGLIGWGEAFGYNAIPASVTALEKIVAPQAVGREIGETARDIAPFMHSLKQPLHIFGRSGPVIYALSGLDIALWDLAGKRAGKSVSQMLSDDLDDRPGGSLRRSITAYTSLMRLREPDLIATACERALNRGFRRLKLHETTVAAVASARQALGDGVDLMLDVNCVWSVDEALDMARQLEPYELKWLEEPVWPPEDAAGLARLRRDARVALAAGENVGTGWAFQALADADALDYYQPSITKLGGVTEFRIAAELARGLGRAVAPHSPYFGPGLLATLHMAAVYPHVDGIELFGVQLESGLFGEVGMPGPNGEIAVPQGPGLGCDPDPAAIARYRIAQAAGIQPQ